MGAIAPIMPANGRRNSMKHEPAARRRGIGARPPVYPEVVVLGGVGAFRERREVAMGFGGGVGLIAAGAVVMWGLDVDPPYIEDHTLGAVLLVAGVVALVGATLMRVQQHPET